MILDLYKHRADDADKAAKPPVPEKPKEPTLAENLQDKQRSVLLGKMLEQKGMTSDEVAEKMKNPTKGDLKEFEKDNAKLNKTMLTLESIDEAITPENLVVFAEMVPDLADQLKLLPPEQFAKVLKEQMPMLITSDKARFDRIAKAVGSLKSYREGAYKKLDEEVAKKCKDLNIDETRLVDIMREPDSAQRIRLLAKEIRSTRVLFDWRGRGRAKKLDAGGGLKSQLEAAKTEVEKLTKEIGKVLQLSVSQNDDFRKAFMQEVTGVKENVNPEKPFREMGREMKSPQDVVDAWAVEKQTPAYLALPDDPARDAHMNAWKDGRQKAEEASVKDKAGFWASVGLSLIKMLFKNVNLER